MFSDLKFVLPVICLLLSCSSRKANEASLTEPGVSRNLAVYRKTVVSNLKYQLNFNLPARKSDAITARETLTFNLSRASRSLPLDFKEDPEKIKSITINGKQTEVNYLNEHLILPSGLLRIGANIVNIAFIAGDGALNRNSDYLYTLFVPDRARTVFPCLDQPDMKAVYVLTLQLPVHWKAQANARLQDSVLNGTQKTYRYAPTDLLSTYHFAFAAGNFRRYTADLTGASLKRDPAGNGNTAFLYRETDPAKLRLSIPSVYKIHSEALKYYEDWTGIDYPYQKFGFVAIPDFQFGGMEHPGTIQYKASSLFLDSGATKDQLNARNNLIAHETAHMWFGDLVTMNWFSDVWMKEVFANFMADKSAGNTEGKDSYALKFLTDHMPAAYGVDRTQGANPIRQPLDNLKDAGSLYGSIIYHKAPIMMQQLEMLMGKTAFQQGVRTYLQKFSNGNASWPDLIRILDDYTPADLQQWNKVWVNESGRPVISYDIQYQDQKISTFKIRQEPESGKKRIWPQTFEVTLFYPDSSKVLQVALKGQEIQLDGAKGLPAPSMVLFNSAGDGYGRFPADPELSARLFGLKDPLHRASGAITLYEQMLAGQSIGPDELLQIFTQGLTNEKEELNLRMLTNYVNTIYWLFTPAQDRPQLASRMEDQIWSALTAHQKPNHKKLLFKLYQDIFLTDKAYAKLYQVWLAQKAPAGVTLAEDDYTSLALALALRKDTDSQILKVQETRISNSDRKQRFTFITPAISSDPLVRDSFFESLKVRANRSRESNVLSALFFLHHPIRQSSSIRYIPQSLALLEEIQTTGDIFFPQSWVQSTLGQYQSPAAAAMVRDFLAAHPDYNPRLKAKILQGSDHLFRAEALLKK